MPSWGLDYEHLLVTTEGSLNSNEVFGSTTRDLDGVEDRDDKGNETEAGEEHEVDEIDYFELDDL